MIDHINKQTNRVYFFTILAEVPVEKLEFLEKNEIFKEKTSNFIS